MFLKNVYLNSLGEKKNVGEEKKGKGRFSQKKNQEGRGKNKGRVYLKIGGIRSLNLGIGISEGKKYI